MFTGLVQDVGRVVEMVRRDSGARLIVACAGWGERTRPGDSIAVQGCCLTHAPPPEGSAPPDEDLLVFDVIAETLRKTTLGELMVGGRVNLEACLTPSTPIGGHFVQGHVDGLATVQRIEASDAEHRLTLGVDDELIRYIVPTGSVALDGVSLTVASVDPAAQRFDVALIPTTLRETTLGELREGDAVNFEGDVLVKSAIHYLRHFADGPRAHTLPPSP